MVNSSPPGRAGLEKNIRLYLPYMMLTSVMPWLSVFYLFFLERVSMEQAITLGAVYYLAVVVFEVPSGYLSDRAGRRPTLMLSALFFLCSYICFILADGMPLLLLGEILLAAGIAFQSGSDTSLLYDTLKLLKRDAEYGDREARAAQYGLIALAMSTLVGGIVGVWDLRLAYVVGIIAASFSLVMAFQFTEPVISDDAAIAARANGFFSQLKECIRYFANPFLAWILAFYVIGYSLQHVPYEFYQPYIELLEVNNLFNGLRAGTTSLTSGVLISISMFGGAWGAACSMRLYKRLGLFKLLMLGLIIICVIIAGLGLALHPLILLLVMFRNFPMAMVQAPMLSTIAPHISSQHRATYLSLQSLAGRLAFSLMMFTLAGISSATAGASWAGLSELFRWSLLVGIVGLLALFVTRRNIEREN
ncbi:MAG: MFS transporter [Granulosicoccaceae bacterium]